MSSKSKKSIVTEFTGRGEFVAASLSFVVITALILFRDEEKISKIKKLFSDKLFLFSTLLIIIFSGYTFSIPSGNNTEILRLHTATKEALLGFLIALLAYLDLKAAPFWIIWLASYYIHV